MPQSNPRPFRMLGRVVGLITLGLVTFFGYQVYARWELRRDSKRIIGELRHARVERNEIRATLVAGGKTDTSDKTTVECELERLEMRSGGGNFYGSGASTILTVIPDGAFVKKGDVLCTLDSSEYEEFVRQQVIKVERAQADLLQAKLNLETAQMALHEFRDGVMAQTIQLQEGEISLARTDLLRAKDRLAWSIRMKDKGYLAMDQVSTARQNLRKAELSLVQANWDQKLFKDFGAPQQVKVLEAKIESARSSLANETRKAERFDERLEYYKSMVSKCTIRAPHDGMVIYAQDQSRQVIIEPGVRVRQKQDLFYLPNLQKMEVLTYLHESVADRVKPGMRAHARIEGMHNKTLHGQISKIHPLPFSPNWTIQTKFFLATVTLDEVPDGLRPEMTAEVEIDVQSRGEALTIPNEALVFDRGEAFCFVMGPDWIERRPVRIGLTNRDLLEIEGGLDEGEEVLIDPGQAESLAAITRETDREPLTETPIAELDPDESVSAFNRAEEEPQPYAVRALGASERSGL